MLAAEIIKDNVRTRLIKYTLNDQNKEESTLERCRDTLCVTSHSLFVLSFTLLLHFGFYFPPLCCDDSAEAETSTPPWPPGKAAGQAARPGERQPVGMVAGVERLTTCKAGGSAAAGAAWKTKWLSGSIRDSRRTE